MNEIDSDQVQIDSDAVYRTLSVHRRRWLIDVLKRAGGRSSLEAVVSALSTDHHAESSQDEQTLQIRLYHIDLPALDAVGLIEWDRTEGTIALTDRAERVPMLDSIPDGSVETLQGTGMPSPEATTDDRPSGETGD